MTGHPCFLSKDEEKLILRHRQLQKHEEYQYLHLLEDILENGTDKDDRTGVGTRSIFGTQMKFDLQKGFPILTTKKVFWKGVVEELLWFIRGETDSNKLSEKGVRIWEGNTSREFLDNKGLKYPEGYIGSGYGFQWRNWGGTYKPYDPELGYFTEPYHKHTLPIVKDGYGIAIGSDGIDQLQNIIDTLKNNPNDRRMIVSAWNVSELDKMVLPPCHLVFQFYVENERLHCQFYMRSLDFFLGVPFNISSYALLTYLIAKVVNIQPGTLTLCGGDTHIYQNHIEQVKTQLQREPYPFPQLEIPDVSSLKDIENLTLSDCNLINYNSHPTIKAEMAV